MAVTRVTLVYHPLHGVDFRISFYRDGAISDPLEAGIQAVIAKINACTRAVALEIELTVFRDIAGSATAGAAYVSEDKGLFDFTDEDGKAHNYKIPGIVPDVLDANKETIDITNPLVTPYITAVTTYCTGRGGATVDQLVKAYRTENRKRLKSGARI